MGRNKVTREMLSCILLSLIAIASSTPLASEEITLAAKTVKDVTSSSAPAYWSAECGGRTYVGSYTVMMDWQDCKDYCKYFPHAGELGHTFTFADIADTDTMECLRFNMMQQYIPGNGYAGHYWVGGYRVGDGQYRWDSGEPFDFNDFVGNPGNEPYIHLTPGNNYQWNTKSDENDRNNGCLCKSEQTVDNKVMNSQSSCENDWYDIGDRCVIMPSWDDGATNYYKALEICSTIYGGTLAEWKDYDDFMRLGIIVHEMNVDLHARRSVWIGARQTEEIQGTKLWTWLSDGDLAFVECDLKYWSDLGLDVCGDPCDLCDNCGHCYTGDTCKNCGGNCGADCSMLVTPDTGPTKVWKRGCGLGGWAGEYAMCQKLKA